MQQIVDWLKKLGMSEYAERFVENRIDFSILPDLTDQHFEEARCPLGDRLKMLRAMNRSLPEERTRRHLAAPALPSPRIA